MDSFFKAGALIKMNDNTLWIGFGDYAWKPFSQLNPKQPAFYFPDFFLQHNTPWLQFEHTKTITTNEILSLIPESHSHLSLKWTPPNQTPFFQAFDELQTAFISSSLIKAVPFSFTYCPQTMSPNQFQISLKNSLQYIQKHHGFIYGFWNEEEGMLGVTPELLFEYQYDKNEKRLSTVALAGTAPKELSLTNFLNNPKDRLEHQITLSGITESLKSFGTVTTGQIEILELPHLNHLLTPIQVKLNQHPHFEDLIQTLHPTPALGAYPKKRGESWLHSYQKKLDRHRFGAPVGFLSQDRTKAQCLVAIRNVQWNLSQMKIGAGCGLIASSQLENEWNEILLKMESIKKILSLI